VHIRASQLANLAAFTHNSPFNASGGFMRVVRSRGLTFGVVIATALCCSLLSTAARAYTPEEQQACSGDAMRLCGPEIPDVDRITACMIARKDELSPACRVFFRSGPEPVADTGAPMNIRPTARKHAQKPRKKKPAAG
jgi:hypothetical protein